MTSTYNKDMYINISNCTQVLEQKGNVIPLYIEPNQILDKNTVKIPLESLSAFKLFDMSFLKKCNNINIVRNYALGDLIQLVPVVRMLPCIKKKITTVDRFVSLKKMFPDIRFSTNTSFEKNEIRISLNGVLERDHSLKNDQRQQHRVDIYSNFLEIAYKKDDLDWSHGMDKKIGRNYAPKDCKVVAVQMRGSGPIKTLPFAFVKRMVMEISKKYKVLLIDQDKKKGFEANNVINCCGKMKTVDIVRTLENCDCVLTMDSGVLWLAHVANCPVVTFLGATRESERLTLHPQYPEGALCINMAKHVGCEPCFETKVRCKGKINCMNSFNHDIIMNEVIEKIENLVNRSRLNDA